MTIGRLPLWDPEVSVAGVVCGLQRMRECCKYCHVYK
jgi:hypothetical protein